MARSRSLMKYQGTVKGVTHVNSPTYGDHVRAPRGTYKKAEVNDVMKEHGERMIGSNQPAKLIRDALAPYRKDFYPGGQLWQKLVQHFAAQKKKSLEYSVEGIGRWNMHSRHNISDVFDTFNLQLDIDAKSAVINFILNYSFTPRFLDRKSNRDGFLITLIVLFPDFTNNKIRVEDIEFPFKKFEDSSPYSSFINIPEGANSYLTCIKAYPCYDGEPVGIGNHAYKIMFLNNSGIINVEKTE